MITLFCYKGIKDEKFLPFLRMFPKTNSLIWDIPWLHFSSYNFP